MTTVFRLHTTLIKLMVLTLGAHLQLLAAHLSVLAETTAAIFLLDYTEVPLSRSPINLTTPHSTWPRRAEHHLRLHWEIHRLVGRPQFSFGMQL